MTQTFTIIGAGEYADDFNDVAHPLRANNYPRVEKTTDGDLSVHASVLDFLADLDADVDGHYDGHSVWIGGMRYNVWKGGPSQARRYTVHITTVASVDDDPTIEGMTKAAEERARRAGMANVTATDVSTPTTRSGYRSVFVTIESDTPAVYDHRSDTLEVVDAGTYNMLRAL